MKNTTSLKVIFFCIVFYINSSDLKAQSIADGIYTISNVHYREELFWDNACKFAFLHWGTSDESNFYWNITHVGNGYYKICCGDKCLDASAGTKGKVQIFKWLNFSNQYGTSGKNQIWKIVPDGQGHYKIFNGWFTDLLLDASKSKKIIQLYGDLGNSSQFVSNAENQKWIFSKRN